MQEIQKFQFQNSSVRTITINTEVWFVAKDICNVLGIQWKGSGNNGSLSDLDDDEKGVSIVDTHGGKQSMGIVSESGMYALIFKSRKEEARAFRVWVTKEVLPAIRKTGNYTASSTMAASQSRFPLFNRPDCVAILAELHKAGEAKLITPEDYSRILFEGTKIKNGITTRRPLLDRFIETNLSIISGQFEKTTDVHARYLSSVPEEITRNKLTHYLVTRYPEIVVKQKKLDGCPTQVYMNVKLTTETIKIDSLGGATSRAIEQRN